MFLYVDFSHLAHWQPSYFCCSSLCRWLIFFIPVFVCFSNKMNGHLHWMSCVSRFLRSVCAHFICIFDPVLFVNLIGCGWWVWMFAIQMAAVNVYMNWQCWSAICLPVAGIVRNSFVRLKLKWGKMECKQFPLQTLRCHQNVCAIQVTFDPGIPHYINDFCVSNEWQCIERRAWVECNVTIHVIRVACASFRTGITRIFVFDMMWQTRFMHSTMDHIIYFTLWFLVECRRRKPPHRYESTANKLCRSRMQTQEEETPSFIHRM